MFLNLKQTSDNHTHALSLQVILECNPNATFTRKGTNLFIKKKISLLEALTGFQFSLDQLDGRKLLVLLLLLSY